MRKLILTCFVVGAVTAGGAAATAAPTAPAAQRNLVQTAQAAGQFTTLVSLVKRAGLAGALTGKTKLTVFAPTDAAFKQVPKATLNKLLADRTLLRRVLLYHVVTGNVKAAQVSRMASVTTMAGPKICIALRGDSVYLNGTTRVVKANVAATNGTIHVVNRVLIPPTS
jgi:uncharacterized surface protein with fasciclin (FAS1) repeats